MGHIKKKLIPKTKTFIVFKKDRYYYYSIQVNSNNKSVYLYAYMFSYMKISIWILWEHTLEL